MPDKQRSYDAGRGPTDRSLRVADHDREAVGDILREQHLAGRLDTDEFQQRLDRAMAARTYADLDQLVADFPREEDEARSPSGGTWRWAPFALVPLIVLIVALGAGGGHPFWLAIPLFLFVVRPLAWRRASGRGARAGWGPCRPRHAAQLDG
jgi:hypothetical protein